MKPSVRRGWSAPKTDPVFSGKAEGNYEIEYRRLREQGLSAEKAQKIASTVAASRAATTNSQEITHATFDVNKGGMQKSQAKPGKSNSEVISAAQARLASGTRTPDEAKWDRKLIQASRDRMKITGETESVPTDIANRQAGLVRHKGQFISKPTDEDIGHSIRAEEMKTQLALSQQRIDATPPAPTRAPTFIAPPTGGSTEPDRIAMNAAKVTNSSAAVSSVVTHPLPTVPQKVSSVVVTPGALTTEAHPDIAAFEKVRVARDAEETAYLNRTGQKRSKPNTDPIVVKTGPVKDIIAGIDRKIEESFRDHDDPSRPTGHHDVDPDKLRKDIKWSEKHGKEFVTTKIPSYSEVGLSYSEAHAILAKEDGLSDNSAAYNARESAAKATKAKIDLQKPTELSGSIGGKPFKHVFNTGEEAQRFIDQTDWKKDFKLDNQKIVENPGVPSVQAAVQAKVAEIAQKRTKLENQVQKALANPDRSKLPADPFQGFRDAEAKSAALTSALTKPTSSELSAHAALAPKKPLSDKQKESLAKAHAAVRAKAAAKKEAAGAGQKFDAIRGGGASGSFEALHPRVPSGNSKGGQWTNKK